jgi:hypothetical protein
MDTAEMSAVERVLALAGSSAEPSHRVKQRSMSSGLRIHGSASSTNPIHSDAGADLAAAAAAVNRSSDGGGGGSDYADMGDDMGGERSLHGTETTLGDEDDAIVGADDELVRPKPGIPHRWQNAAMPIFVVVSSVLIGLVVSGYYGIPEDEREGATLKDMFSESDSFKCLLWASLTGLFFPLFSLRIQVCVR